MLMSTGVDIHVLSTLMQKNSNDVFRTLFEFELMADEKIFEAPNSPFKSDGRIGTDPSYDEALTPEENHWCMVKGLSNEMDGNLAFVLENPLDDRTWPPVWNADAAGLPKQGRAWKGAKIVIGRHDGSVDGVSLRDRFGTRVPVRDGDKQILFPPGGSFLPVAK